MRRYRVVKWVGRYNARDYIDHWDTITKFWSDDLNAAIKVASNLVALTQDQENVYYSVEDITNNHCVWGRDASL